jgi:phosphate-selective porin
MRFIQFLFFSALLFSAFSCKTGKKTATDKAGASIENFDQFYNRFHSDEDFQMSRIRFPIEGLNIDGNQTTTWNKNNWAVLTVRIFDIDKKKFKTTHKKTDNSFEQKVWIEDSGFLAEHKFKLIGKKWYLVYAYDQNL